MPPPLSVSNKTKLRLADIAMESDLCNYTASVVVTSDTCFKEPKKDLSGDFVVNSLRAMRFGQVNKYIVPDESELITLRVKTAAEELNNILVITVGGTGLCPRDVTPEATSELYDKRCPGLVTSLIVEGLKHSPHAALSRLTAGIHGRCIIVNFPGKTKACVECFGCLSRILGHALEQVVGDLVAVDSAHRLQAVILPKAIDETSVPTSPSEGCMIKSLSGLNLAESLKAPSPPISPPPRHRKPSNSKASPESKPLTDLNDPMLSSLSLPVSKPLKTSCQYPLIDYEKALSIMGSLAYIVCQMKHSVQLNSSESALSILGDILAENVRSKITLPPFPVSTMDGFVLNIPKALTDVMAELGIVEATLVKDLEVFEKLQHDPDHCFSFFCYQVNTGGRVPEQNFAVIPVERTARISKDTITIAKIESNKFVRKAGSDLCLADRLKAGTVIGPVELSILLSMGCREVTVTKRPTIGVLSTGDELEEFYEYDKSDKSKVINTNGPLLTALFKGRNFLVTDFGMAKDNPKDILLKIHTGLKESDILLITGGASMGSKDHVKDVVEQIGGIIHFGRVNIKPGKPAALASIMVGGKRKFIFCLPGNPVSAYITSLVLVLPFIEHGIRNHLGFDVPLTIDSIGDIITVEISNILDLESDAYKFDGRLEFARAHLSKKLNKSHLATVSMKQQSSRLLSLKDFDCLILVDPSKRGSKFMVGQTYQALRIRA